MILEWERGEDNVSIMPSASLHSGMIEFMIAILTLERVGRRPVDRSKLNTCC